MRNLASLATHGTVRNMTDECIVAEYGATPSVLLTLWKLLCCHLSKTSQPLHLRWWLYNCKHYPTKSLLLEKALCVSAPTSRKAMQPFKEAFLKIRVKVVGELGCLFYILYFVVCVFLCFHRLRITLHSHTYRSDSVID